MTRSHCSQWQVRTARDSLGFTAPQAEHDLLEGGLTTVGIVLMVGIAGLVISLVWQAPPGGRTLCITGRGDDVEPRRGDDSRL
jgi:hypothetical protein